MSLCFFLPKIALWIFSVAKIRADRSRWVCWAFFFRFISLKRASSWRIYRKKVFTNDGRALLVRLSGCQLAVSSLDRTQWSFESCGRRTSYFLSGNQISTQKTAFLNNCCLILTLYDILARGLRFVLLREVYLHGPRFLFVIKLASLQTYIITQ